VDSTMQYKNFRLYSRMILYAKTETGELRSMRWLRSVAERKGSFKVYSTDD